jgi:hypothetical protein
MKPGDLLKLCGVRPRRLVPHLWTKPPKNGTLNHSRSLIAVSNVTVMILIATLEIEPCDYNNDTLHQIWLLVVSNDPTCVGWLNSNYVQVIE